MIDPNFVSLLNKSFTVTRRSRTERDDGGFDTSFSTVGTVLGRLCIASNRGREFGMAGRASDEFTHILFTLPGVNIQRDDVVIPVAPASTKKFRIVNAAEPSEMGHHIEWHCEEIQTYTVPTS